MWIGQSVRAVACPESHLLLAESFGRKEVYPKSIHVLPEVVEVQTNERALTDAETSSAGPVVYSLGYFEKAQYVGPKSSHLSGSPQSVLLFYGTKETESVYLYSGRACSTDGRA